MDVEAAVDVINHRVVAGTTSNYRGKLNTIKVYFATRGDAEYLVDENNEICLPLENEVIQELFGWLSRNTDIPTRKRQNVDEDGVEEEDEAEEDEDIFARRAITISPSTMQGYKSTLKWYYAEKEVEFPRDIDKWLDRFIKGYKKIISEKRRLGYMPVSEGRI